MHAAIDRTEPNRLNVKWKVDCSDKLIVQKFNITICEGDMSTKCLSSFTNETARNYEIQDLKPFTVYKVLVNMISTTGKPGAAFEVHEKTTETGEIAFMVILLRNSS